jgi:hypothetical protein
LATETLSSTKIYEIPTETSEEREPEKFTKFWAKKITVYLSAAAAMSHERWIFSSNLEANWLQIPSFFKISKFYTQFLVSNLGLYRQSIKEIAGFGGIYRLDWGSLFS